MEPNKDKIDEEENENKDEKDGTNSEEHAKREKEKDNVIEWPCGKCGGDAASDSVRCNGCNEWYCIENCSGLSDLAEHKDESYLCTDCIEAGVKATYSSKGGIKIVKVTKRVNRTNKNAKKGVKTVRERGERRRKRDLNEVSSPEKTTDGTTSRPTKSPTEKRRKIDDYIKSKIVFSLVEDDIREKRKVIRRRVNKESNTQCMMNKSNINQNKEGEDEVEEKSNNEEEEERNRDEERMKEMGNNKKKDENKEKKDKHMATEEGSKDEKKDKITGKTEGKRDENTEKKGNKQDNIAQKQHRKYKGITITNDDRDSLCDEQWVTCTMISVYMEMSKNSVKDILPNHKVSFIRPENAQIFKFGDRARSKNISKNT